MKKVLVLENVAKYLENKGICTFDQAMEYIEAENDYFDLINFNVYDKEIEDLESEAEPMTIDDEEGLAYITAHSSLDTELIMKIYDAYIEYLIENEFMILVEKGPDSDMAWFVPPHTERWSDD